MNLNLTIIQSWKEVLLVHKPFQETGKNVAGSCRSLRRRRAICLAGVVCCISFNFKGSCVYCVGRFITMWGDDDDDAKLKTKGAIHKVQILISFFITRICYAKLFVFFKYKAIYLPCQNVVAGVRLYVDWVLFILRLTKIMIMNNKKY